MSSTQETQGADTVTKGTVLDVGTPNSTSGHKSGEDQQAGEQFKLKDIQLDLNNLVKVDEKLVALSEALKKNNIGVISQLCSDWWELTDEDDYAVAKFQQAYKDERAKKDIKQMMALEILSIAVVNYFTSSPEIFKPTNVQLSQVKNLLSHVHQNFLSVIDLLLSKLPQENLKNNFALKLQSIIK